MNDFPIYQTSCNVEQYILMLITLQQRMQFHIKTQCQKIKIRRKKNEFINA